MFTITVEWRVNGRAELHQGARTRLVLEGRRTRRASQGGPTSIGAGAANESGQASEPSSSQGNTNA
jgi:hypothetical protein